MYSLFSKLPETNHSFQRNPNDNCSRDIVWLSVLLILRSRPHSQIYICLYAHKHVFQWLCVVRVYLRYTFPIIGIDRFDEMKISLSLYYFMKQSEY